MFRTTLIGLDGATFTVLDALMAEGQMPRLGELVRTGVRAELLSTPHPLTPPAWTTLMTGRSPGHHGVFDFLRAERRARGAFFTLTDFRDIRCETIWSIVSRQGGSITSLNFPLMAPPPAVNGCIVPGQLSSRHLRRNVRPKEFYDQLKALPGFRPDALNWDFETEKKALHSIPEEELADWVQFHIDRERHWFAAARHAMRTTPSDLTAVLFDGVDKIQHACWRYVDPRLSHRDPTPFERRVRKLCVQFFQELDGFIGELVDLGGEESRVFLASDHGFDGSSTVFRANTWLQQQGYLSWPEGEDFDLGAGGPVKAGHHVPIDMRRTAAYVQSAATNGIHIHVSREPSEGGVQPERYESFREELIEKLLAIRHPETHVPIVARVLKREDVFPGPHVEQAPDLTLVMYDYGFISALRTEETVFERPEVIGTHRPEGVFIAHGPGVRSGLDARPQKILDTAATFLFSLGLPIPEDFESRVIEEIFEPALLERQPVRVGPPTQSPGAAADAAPSTVDADEEAKILDRLRALGYVE